MRPNGESRGSALPWVPVLIGGAALAALTAGGVLAYRSLGGAEPGSGITSADPCCADPAVLAAQPPSYFGFPEYPTAFDFHSMATGKQVYGSASYSVKKGTAADVAGFYRKTLEAKGWSFAGKQTARERPGEPGSPTARTVTGLRLTWARPSEDRRLTLTALDFPQKSSSAQVSLSWKPLSEGR